MTRYTSPIWTIHLNPSLNMNVISTHRLHSSWYNNKPQNNLRSRQPGANWRSYPGRWRPRANASAAATCWRIPRPRPSTADSCTGCTRHRARSGRDLPRDICDFSGRIAPFISRPSFSLCLSFSLLYSLSRSLFSHIRSPVISLSLSECISCYADEIHIISSSSTNTYLNNPHYMLSLLAFVGSGELI